MNFGVRTILLLVAVVLFVLGIFMDVNNFDEMLFLGLAGSRVPSSATRSATPTAPSAATGATTPNLAARMGIRERDAHRNPERAACARDRQGWISGGNAGAR